MKDDSNPQKTAVDLGRALRQQEVAFLVGAGVSARRQSWLPTWRALTESMLFELAGQKGQKELPSIIQHLDRLLTEVIFQLMIPEIRQKSAFEPLYSTMSHEDYSAIHKFLAWCVIYHNAVVLTTNYDNLIENAARKGLKFTTFKSYVRPEEYQKWDGLSGALMKLHGTVEDLDSARFAINQVFRGLDPAIEDAVRKVLQNRVLIVVGYRGADEFDINPVLFDSEHPSRGIVWLVRKGSSPESWVQTYLRNVGDTWLEVEPDAFLKSLYLCTSGNDRRHRDEELERWEIIGRSIPHEDWWKSRLMQWGVKLRKNDPGGVAFLWARILEYLYFYKEAAAAYDRARKLLGVNAKSLEARFRQAWMSRQAAKSDAETERALQDLHDVAKTIEIHMENQTSSLRQRKFRHMLGSAMHQIGIALQGLKRFEEARDALGRAAQIRRESKDKALPYTIFQQFINARQATHVGQREIDDFAPKGWRRWLSDYLADAASKYKREGLVADYATTVHNRAFVHQSLAEEFEKQGKYDAAEPEFRIAWTLYLDAWNYRHRLYDQRYVAQSEVRLAECELGLARQAMHVDSKFLGRLLAQHAFERTVIVRELYERIPQQEFRTQDVEKIEEDATRIIKDCGFRPLRPYLH